MNEKYRLESQISKLIFDDNGSDCSFEYSLENSKVVLITYNPKHDEHFKFGEVDLGDGVSLINEGTSWEQLLNPLLRQVKELTKSDSHSIWNSYSVIWKNSDREIQHTSYFHSDNIQDVLDKFYYNKDKSTVQIFEIKLNPIA